jgi:MFS family permease
LCAPWLSFLLLLQVLMGLFSSLVTMSNTRLAMVIVPAMGRNHFFALFSVIGSVSLGLAPILWGMVIDGIGKWETTWLKIEWNRYTIFFAGVSAAFVVALWLASRLQEPEAAGIEQLLKDLLIQSPQRVLVRLWPR